MQIYEESFAMVRQLFCTAPDTAEHSGNDDRGTGEERAGEYGCVMGIS